MSRVVGCGVIYASDISFWETHKGWHVTLHPGLRPIDRDRVESVIRDVLGPDVRRVSVQEVAQSPYFPDLLLDLLFGPSGQVRSRRVFRRRAILKLVKNSYFLPRPTPKGESGGRGVNFHL
jgi:hypothetical protein